MIRERRSGMRLEFLVHPSPRVEGSAKSVSHFLVMTVHSAATLLPPPPLDSIQLSRHRTKAATAFVSRLRCDSDSSCLQSHAIPYAHFLASHSVQSGNRVARQSFTPSGKRLLSFASRLRHLSFQGERLLDSCSTSKD